MGIRALKHVFGTIAAPLPAAPTPVRSFPQTQSNEEVEGSEPARSEDSNPQLRKVKTRIDQVGLRQSMTVLEPSELLEETVVPLYLLVGANEKPLMMIDPKADRSKSILFRSITQSMDLNWSHHFSPLWTPEWVCHPSVVCFQTLAQSILSWAS